jgi:opacity protein-like surface antigen
VVDHPGQWPRRGQREQRHRRRLRRLRTATPTTLVYATGGVAWSTVSIPGVDTLPANQTKNGWVAGGGVEWKPWDDHWSIRAEYLYYRFTSVLLGAGFGGNLEVSEGRIGAAYKF